MKVRTPEILLVTKEPTLLASVRICLEAAGVDFVLSPDPARAKAAELLIVDHRGLAEAELAVTLKAFGERVILLTSQEDKDNINRLLAVHPVSHVIGLNGRSFLTEIATTVRKLLSGDIFGMAHYFDRKAHFASCVIASADQVDEAIESMLAKTDMKDSFSATHEFLRMTANELVTNAVYNAPVDAEGKPKYEHTDRKHKVKLSPAEAVTLAVSWDEDSIGISVSDQFGRLEREKIVRHLVKCVNNTAFIENKRGGAGAGIYLAFYTANQFVINADPGKRLEVICILEKNKRYKEYRQRVTSFHYFKAVDAAKKKIGGAA